MQIRYQTLLEETVVIAQMLALGLEIYRDHDRSSSARVCSLALND